MAAAPAVIVLLSLLLSSWGYHAEDTPAILLQVVDAVEKMIRFYKTNYQYMNLDGIYGLKIVEGQIQKLLDEHRQGKHASLSSVIVARLSTLWIESKQLGEQALAVVHADDKKYFQDLAFMIAQPWTLFKQHRKIVPSLRWEIPVYQSGASFKIDEAQSDKCMMEITPTNKTKADHGSKLHCGLTEQCALIMTKRGLTEYSITHQILWTALAEKSGCGLEMNTLLKKLGFKSTDHMQEEFCTNNYYEMLAVVHVFMSGTVRESYQDVFLEQQFVCPSLGFFEFLKKKYLDQILSWQLPSGCFGDESTIQDHHPRKRSPKVDSKSLQLPQKLKGVPDINSLDLRKKQISQQLKDLKSDSEIGKLSVHQKNSKKDQLDVMNGQPQKMNVKRSVVSNNEHQPNLKLQVNKERNVVLSNQGFDQLRPQKGNDMHINAREVPVLRAEIQDQRNKAPPPFDKKPLSQSQHAAAGTNKRNLAYNSQLQYPKQNNKMPIKLKGEPQVDIGIRQKQNQKEPVAQNVKYVRDGASALRPQDGSQNAPLPAHAPDMPQHHVQPGHKLLSLYSASRGSRRKLLVEKEMPGGCLAHKTGVAGGALVMYLRYLIDPGPLDLFAPHDFFPDASRGLLGHEKDRKDVINFLQNQMDSKNDDKHNQVEFDTVVGFNQLNEDEDGEEEEEEEEEEEDEDGEYDDREDLYPDAGEDAGQQQERKVVHFGANDNPQLKHQDNGYDDNKEDENDDYNDENEDEEEEEEEGDYIKRVKGDDDGVVNPIEKDNIDDDTEYTYYDDDDDTDRGIIKRHKPQAPPQKGARIRTHNRHKPHPPSIDQVPMGLPDSPPTKTVVVLLSATSLLLIIFMYKFVTRRRFHFRHNSRGFFKL